MKIVIIGAGSVAFTPAMLSGFSVDQRYRGATLGFVDINQKALDLASRFARRVSDEFGLEWKIEASTDRRDILPGSDVVTTSIGVGGLDAWIQDVEIPFKYDVIQPVGDTSGPGGLARALRHIPVLVEVAQDMERLCPQATLYNFTNPLTVLTQAVRQHSRIDCAGLCIGVDLTWDHLCRVVGVKKNETSILAGGINHCHWVYDFRVRGVDGMPLLAAAFAELDGNPQAMQRLKDRYGELKKRPQEPNAGQPLCVALFRQFGAYPGPGDGHVGEFYPQLMRAINVIASEAKQSRVLDFQGSAIRYVQQSYPVLTQKMKDIALHGAPIEAESFARELSWEHTQLLDILISRQDNLGQTFYVNLPNRGIISNLPEGAVVEIPATVDAEGIHPITLGELPAAVTPTLAHKLASLDLIIEAALEGSRRKAVQALINDPHCTDIAIAEKMVNELIDAEIQYLPRFH
jgi:alpha-galactosidase